ncbi:MAG: DmsE family decaheme c-type cytochrome [bacterium]|nr:MAG: DmsE family decaheme c-type cytochrome [bacterium]
MPRLTMRAFWKTAVSSLILLTVLFSFSCASMKASRPMVPMREYERMLVGSLFADYVGNEACLAACHKHDEKAAFLAESVHGRQKVEGTDMPLVNCETCHGPGSEAIEPGFVNQNGQCDTTRFVPLQELPPSALSMLCLKCHSSYSMSNMQFWPFSDHAQAEVSCPQCHQLHKSSRQKLKGTDINRQCLGCHVETKLQFSQTYRHPLHEGRILCVDCHNPHGSQNPYGLIAMDQKSLCLNCHGQVIGPFAWEHADVTDSCTNCHQPHGSVFADMLTVQEPFLCLQCHAGHTDPSSPTSPSAVMKGAFYTRCTNCHSQIHGTDTRGPHPGSGLTQ